ncbi:MAG: M3 family oligoendopeptidase [Rhodopirellula sp.]|nr:M3 family oligoendopeptidase [Rhodopirellula sp.]
MSERYPLNWELDSLYPHPESAEFRTIVEQLKSVLSRLAETSDRLPAIDPAAATVSAWSVFLNQHADAYAEFSAINAFIGCHAAADAANKTYQRFEGELSALSPLKSQIATNIEFAFQTASDETFVRFIAAEPFLQENAYFLELCRRCANLRLPKEQELLAAELDVDGLHAWGRVYDRLSGGLRIAIQERGEIVERSPGQVQFDMPQRPVRENNFYAADKAWASLSDSCAEAINHIAGSRLSKYRRLGVDHLAAPLHQNHMTRETLDTMWSTVTTRKCCVADYLKKKAELLGVERLSWFDQQAPLPLQSGIGNSELSYDEACVLTINAFSEFSPELGNFARMAITEKWIEVEDRPGKRQGGFCTDMPTRKQSRIFMTFTRSNDSMSTLAHELGHAYHTWVLRDQPVFHRDYPMNLAETASTFAESVLAESRLSAASSRQEKLEILDGMLSDSVSFLMNIHARFIFEDRFHQERAAGEVSVTRLGELMKAAQQEAYCDALAEDGWNPNFWISKLHFYITDWPFYNFPYTFGYLLSLGTYSLAKDAVDFPRQFRDFLIATGCQDTEAAVESSFGYDLRQPEFWNRSLDIIEQRVQKFLELAD